MRKNQHQAGRRVQLHRAVSKLGWGSRTQAWDWIRRGEVDVDGRSVTDPLTWVDLDRQQIVWSGGRATDCAVLVPLLTLALHKPRGIITSRHDERGRRTVYDLLPPGLPWVFPAGRLDADSEGLLILTNDSRLAMRLTDPEHHVPKTYRVTVSGTPASQTLEQLRGGVKLADGRTRPASVRLVEARPKTAVIDIVLTEGCNRQVRRMCAAVGHRVKRLVRMAIGGYPFGNLPAGACRVLDEEDIVRLLAGSAAS